MTNDITELLSYFVSNTEKHFSFLKNKYSFLSSYKIDNKVFFSKVFYFNDNFKSQ